MMETIEETPEQRAVFAVACEDGEFIRLAKLPTSEYERTRVNAAKELGFRVSVLDRKVAEARKLFTCVSNDAESVFPSDPDPWHESVDGVELVRDLESMFRRFVVAPENAFVTLVLWVLHSHAHTASISSARTLPFDPLQRYILVYSMA